MELLISTVSNYYVSVVKGNTWNTIAVFEHLTTRLRLVFDTSEAGSKGRSLIDILYPGPTIQQSLISIVICVRTFRFLFLADV